MARPQPRLPALPHLRGQGTWAAASGRAHRQFRRHGFQLWRRRRPEGLRRPALFPDHRLELHQAEPPDGGRGGKPPERAQPQGRGHRLPGCGAGRLRVRGHARPAAGRGLQPEPEHRRGASPLQPEQRVHGRCADRCARLLHLPQPGRRGAGGLCAQAPRL